MSLSSPFQRVIDAYFVDLTKHPMPTPDLANELPNGFNREKLKVNKDSSILLHSLLISPPSAIKVEPHPAFEYEIFSFHYFVYPREEEHRPLNVGVNLTEAIQSLTKLYPYPDIQDSKVIDTRDILSETITFPEFPACLELTSQLNYQNVHNFEIEVPKIVLIKQPTPIVKLPAWNDMKDSMNVFEIAPESIKLIYGDLKSTTMELLRLDNFSTMSYQLEPKVMIQDLKIVNKIECTFPKWLVDTAYEYPNVGPIKQFLFDKNRITASGKYFVYPVTRFIREVNHDNENPSNASRTLTDAFFRNHFRHDEVWNLHKHILINDMTWNPFSFDIERFADLYLVEQIETKKILYLLSHCEPCNEFVIPNAESHEDQINTNERWINTQMHPIVNNDKTSKPSETIQLLTNVATYHNDTAEIEKLASLRRIGKINHGADLILPPEISILLLFEPNNTFNEGHSRQDNQESLELPKPEEVVNMYLFTQTQNIIINQKLWDTNYHLANLLSKQIKVIEAKLPYPIDIIINATVGIYLTTSDHLVQVDIDNNFLILEALLKCKQYLNSIHVVGILTNSWFLEHSGENLQKLQILCLSLDISVSLVPSEEFFGQIIQLIELESPEELDNSIETANQDCIFLCECGLSFFQSARIIKLYSLEEFVICDIHEKLNKFGDFIPDNGQTTSTSTRISKGYRTLVEFLTMVVLSGSICTRGGKPLLSRQFRDISRDRITALLANFPSLISNSSGQHTSVEDDNVRYVYQPLEEFYIVLITNKTSNILQDIDTLHLFASTISNLLRNIDEREIFESSFEIIDAFDEIINLGYKENLTLTQVQTFLEMDSHEEKIQEIIERNKELEAAEERKRRAKEIQRKELARKNMEQLPVGGSGIGSSSFGYDSYQNNNQPTYQPTQVVETANHDSISAGGMGHSLLSKPRGGGLQLGSKKPAGRSLPSAAGAHEPLLTGATNNQPLFAHKSTPANPSSVTAAAAAGGRTESSPAPSITRVPNNGILITINEKVNAEVSREGSISSSEVKGDLQLRINQVELSNAKILLKIAGDKKQFKTHPNVDRNLFQLNNVITVKDKSKTFPSNDQPLGVLRWRSVGKQDDTSLVPFIFTIWVNAIDGEQVQVTLEYELSSEFITNHPNHPNIENLKILIPVVTQDVHLQSEDSSDSISYDVYEDQGIVFNIGSISIDEPQGSFEFTIGVSDEESLFPMQAQFEINNQEVVENDVSLGGVSVIDVVSNTEDEESLPFDLHSNIASETYLIQ